MKRAKITCGIICSTLAIVICVAVCRQWAAQGCEEWSLIAAILFYSAGCYGLWIVLRELIEVVYRYDEDEKYPDNPTIR